MDRTQLEYSYSETITKRRAFPESGLRRIEKDSAGNFFPRHLHESMGISYNSISNGPGRS